MSEKKINPDCPCTSSCVRHGDCEACQENHKGGLTACQKAKQKSEGK
jgi:hypothetical protein